MIVNHANLTNFFIGLSTAYNTGFRMAKPMWSGIATLVPSTTAEEKYAWLGQFPRLREWLGDRVIKNMTAHDYAIRNKKFESTIEVLRDHLEDDSFGVYTPLAQEMGFAAATHPDELIWGLLQNGFAELCYDGQYFFDTDHPVGPFGAEVSVSNMQAGAGNPWFLMDTRRPLKPLIFQKRRDYQLRSMTAGDDEKVFMRDTFRYGIDARVNTGFGFWQQAFASKAALDQTNFDTAIEAMLSLRSDENRPLGIKPNWLVVGPTNRKQALEVVKAERLANGATNVNREVVDVLVCEWLL